MVVFTVLRNPIAVCRIKVCIEWSGQLNTLWIFILFITFRAKLQDQWLFHAFFSPVLNNKLEPVWLWIFILRIIFRATLIDKWLLHALSPPRLSNEVEAVWLWIFILIDYLSSYIKRYVAASCPLHPPRLHSDLEPICLWVFILLITFRATLHDSQVLHVLSLVHDCTMSWERYGSVILSYWLPFELHYKTRGCFMPLPSPTFTQWARTGIALNMLLYVILKIILTENDINVSRVFL